jgi:hypothetical protein
MKVEAVFSVTKYVSVTILLLIKEKTLTIY